MSGQGGRSLFDAVTELEAVAARAGVAGQSARAEALSLAAALAESAPGAPADWAKANPGATTQDFFDAAVRGRRWRGAPTAILTELVTQSSPEKTSYAQALAEVASAACTLGEPTMRVVGNAAVAAAAQLQAAGAAPHPTQRFTGSTLSNLFPPPLVGQSSPTTQLTPGENAAPATSEGPAGPVSAEPGSAGAGGLGVAGSEGLGTGGAGGGPLPLGGPAGQQVLTPEQAASDPTGVAPSSPALVQPERSVDELLGELDALVGLESVKREVHRQVAVLRMEKLRSEAGLKSPTITRHLVFVGNPGTGKTTVARLVSGIYKALGLLSKGQLAEVDRSELVAGYLGQTATKTAEVVASAAGGVLFIDEAYSLTAGDHGADQYGREAVDTLVKEMEDRRDDLVVIVAGYPRPMAAFIAANPGLASRFRTTILFDDYTDDELTAILTGLAAAADYELAEPTLARFREILAGTYRDHSFGNGRFARNMLEAAIGRHAWRLRDETAPTHDQLRQILPEDLTDEDPTEQVEQPEPAAADDTAAEEQGEQA